MTLFTNRLHRLLEHLALFLDSHSLSAHDALALGHENAASARRTLALGYQASADHYGSLAHAAGARDAVGDSQRLLLHLTGETSGAATATLTLPDGSRPTIPQLCAWAFTLTLTARRSDGTGKSGAYLAAGGLHRDALAATTRLTGAGVATVIMSELDSAYTISITADATNGALQVDCTGIAGQTVQWYGYLEIAQNRVTL